MNHPHGPQFTSPRLAMRRYETMTHALGLPSVAWTGIADRLALTGDLLAGTDGCALLHGAAMDAFARARGAAVRELDDHATWILAGHGGR